MRGRRVRPYSSTPPYPAVAPQPTPTNSGTPTGSVVGGTRLDSARPSRRRRRAAALLIPARCFLAQDLSFRRIDLESPLHTPGACRRSPVCRGARNRHVRHGPVGQGGRAQPAGGFGGLQDAVGLDHADQRLRRFGGRQPRELPTRREPHPIRHRQLRGRPGRQAREGQRRRIRLPERLAEAQVGRDAVDRQRGDPVRLAQPGRLRQWPGHLRHRHHQQ